MTTVKQQSDDGPLPAPVAAWLYWPPLAATTDQWSWDYRLAAAGLSCPGSYLLPLRVAPAAGNPWQSARSV
jgi:hypothetical protein